MSPSGKQDEGSSHQDRHDLQQPESGEPADGHGGGPLSRDDRPLDGEGASSQDGWRDLALRIKEERDPEKMLELVQRLITKFDEQKAGNHLPPTSRPGKRDPESG